jgi:hypothetical protein
MNPTLNEGAGAPNYAENANEDLDLENVNQDDGEQDGDEGTQGEDGKAQQPKDDPVKTLQQRLAKQERRINNITASKYALKRELDELRAYKAQMESERKVQGIKMPKPDDFKDFDEYHAALTEAQMQKLLAQQQGQQNQNPAEQGRVPAQEQQWHNSMQQQALGQAQQLAQHIGDFAETWDGVAPLLDAMPYAIEKAFYQTSQHPALAVYVLAKEGVLADVLEMPPQQAAQYIAQATQLGIQNIQQWAGNKSPQGKPAAQQQQPTGAPPPLSPSKAGSRGARSEDEMSGSELLKKYNVS